MVLGEADVCARADVLGRIAASSNWAAALVRAYGSSAAEELLTRLDLEYPSTLENMRVRAWSSLTLGVVSRLLRGLKPP